MLFSNGFHRGFHSRPPRSYARGAAGVPSAQSGAEPASSPLRRRDNSRPGAVTIVTIRDEKNPRRMKTIITLKRKSAPAAALPRRESQASTSVAGLSTPSHASTSVTGLSTPERRSSSVRSRAKKADLLADESCALLTPESPASTLLSGRNVSSVHRFPSCHSSESGRIGGGSEDSYETALTQVDDGLSDWGLPKVIDYHNCGQEFDEECSEIFEGYGAQPLVSEFANNLEASVLPYDEPTVASLDYPSPSPAQIRMQRFMTLVYVMLVLKKRGVVPPRFGRPTTNPAVRPARAPNPRYLSILPFASWL